MRPSPLRYILAYTAEISMGFGVIGALAIMLVTLHSHGVLIPKFAVTFWVILASLPVAAIGYVVGLIFIWHLMLGRLAARLQGWPFAVGEKVRILRGTHKDTISTVYAVWWERGQVRVELGNKANDKFEDVFSAVAVCRARNIEPSAASQPAHSP